jgi:hypothetical protein
MKNDFKFLVEMIQKKDFIGEFDIALRDDYFNIYYQGNSLAKVEFCKDNNYRVIINNKFFDKNLVQNIKCEYKEKKGYIEIVLGEKLLHPFFQKKNITKIISNIRKVNYSEELTREQAIITDNLNRDEIVFIDRQVMGGSFPGRLDLLALQQVEENKYCFLVIEVKLGKNPELNNDVAKQLKKYIDYIDKNFDGFKTCYEKNYEQKKELGLFNIPNYSTIEIVKPVKGMVVVAGYSGIANNQIAQLKKNFPTLDVKQVINKI